MEYDIAKQLADFYSTYKELKLDQRVLFHSEKENFYSTYKELKRYSRIASGGQIFSFLLYL